MARSGRSRDGKLQRCDAVALTEEAAGALASFQQLLFTEKHRPSLCHLDRSAALQLPVP